MSKNFDCYVCENVCVYSGSAFLWIWLTPDLNSALDSIDRVKNLSIENLDYSLVFNSI